MMIAAEAKVNHENAIVTSFVASRKNYLFIKRGFDLAFSLIGILLVLSWLLPLIAILIKVDSKGPVFFRQQRMGKNGKSFTCLKFRTMIKNMEADKKPAEENDHRITRAGKILRKTNLDELPQLFNVLIGDMSIVGPRPHMLADCERFAFIIGSYKFRALVKPGITGLAQVKGYHGPALEKEEIINRYSWDAIYVRRASIGLDIKIIYKTIGKSLLNLF